ncbi:hypothetical protein CK203_090713 [Vitis vinifera]|uniref:Uncharacterized protein n=1 Tax=Vitis vinifera TaxID=29760 RepID=A0A438BX28_VITVI|nr:hypothetical protein CK203_090713 [Vitis vinifera]
MQFRGGVVYLWLSLILQCGARRFSIIKDMQSIEGDIQALEDLTYEKKEGILEETPFATSTPSQVPIVAPLTAGQPAKVPVIIPLGAAMAACAQLLQIRYGEKSDGLVTCRDAQVPGSIVVRPKRKLDHAWMVYSALDDDPTEANASQVVKLFSGC